MKAQPRLWKFAARRKMRRASQACLVMAGGHQNAGAGKASSSAAHAHEPQSRAATRLVVGLGKTGASVARYLERGGLPFAITDSRDQPPGAGSIAEAPHRFGQFESPLPFAELAEAVVSPGISSREPFLHALQTHGVPLISDVELFARAVTCPVVAITGTNGKSTVALLVTAMAQAAGWRVAAGGNLGTPALDLLSADTDLYVLELSSFQLERTRSLKPAVAVVLNLSADHLDWHASIEAYAAAKARIYAHAAKAVSNRDDAQVMRMTSTCAAAVSFGLDVPAAGHYGLREKAGELWLCRGESELLAAREVPLAGRHNLANVLAAWALGAAIGLDEASMASAVRSFKALPHRLAQVAKRAGVRYLDDSKATNVSAACAALSGMSAPCVVIAGGQGKGQDFAPFADCLVKRARAVVVMGAAAADIEHQLHGRLPVVHAPGMAEAVGLAASLAQVGDNVILAPACASQDMFADYHARGQAFVQAVESLDGH